MPPAAPKRPPKWRQLADEIAAQVITGAYAPGERLPSVQAQVSAGKGATATVHRAYQALEAEGIVRTVQGSGTTVLGPDSTPLSTVTGAARLERLRRTGRALTPHEIYVNSQVALRSCADPQMADLLGIDLYDEVVLRSRTFVREDRPTVLALNVIHTRALAVLPELLQPETMEPFRHEVYRERSGKSITAGPSQSAARHASDNELSDFGIDVPPGIAVPVLVLRCVFSDEDGPLEVWEDVLRPGMWHSNA